ncbi:MAG TPA: hypothetical protein VGI34_03275, partial [Candidatus Acidoferrales bacterium]
RRQPGMRLQEPLRPPVCAPTVDMRRGPEETILDLGEISRVETSATGTPPHLPHLRTASGVLSVARTGVAVLRLLNRKAEQRAAGKASTCSAGIVEQNPEGLREVFQERGMKFGKTLPPREISFPNPNRLQRFTIRSAVHSQAIQGCSQTPGCQPLRVSRADRLLWLIADFHAA